MKRTFKHLNLQEREKYFAWRESGVSLREIGRRLGRPHSTFSREPYRNAKYGQIYLPCLAQRKADKRGERQRRRAPLKSPLVFLYVRKHLREDGWSPEQIAGRLPIDYPGESVHFETICRYIYLGRNETPRLKAVVRHWRTASPRLTWLRKVFFSSWFILARQCKVFTSSKIVK